MTREETPRARKHLEQALSPSVRVCHNAERVDLDTGVKKVTGRMKWVHLFFFFLVEKVVNYR